VRAGKGRRVKDRFIEEKTNDPQMKMMKTDDEASIDFNDPIQSEEPARHSFPRGTVGTSMTASRVSVR
jgi:hypothetical protein